MEGLTMLQRIRSLTIVAVLALIVARAPAESVAELLVYARANPGKLNYATGNSTSLLATARLKMLERIDMVEVPYKGDAPATLDLVAGRVQLMIATPGTAAAFVKEGKLRA